ncbi:MAG: hypothetical protein IJ003_04640 [Candidatus Gastranaerophilales bacterium]|nr:hypothetical protein [Candidatus Gastranaerophilales bacterium]
MSRLKLDEINFNDDDFVVEIKNQSNKDVFKNTKKHSNFSKNKAQNPNQEQLQKELEEAQQIISKAQLEAQEILNNAKNEVDQLISKTNEELDLEKIKVLQEAQKNADEILTSANENSKKEAQDLIEHSKEDIEKARIEATNDGYKDGYKDGLEKIQEELEEKIKKFDKFCQQQYEIKEKIIKSASRDILDLITNISKKILLKEVDSTTLDKIIKSSISLLEKKENINIIVSEKYAKLLFELQQKTLEEETELRFEDFKHYDNFNIIYNSKFDDDTIIIENLKERLDASIKTQLDVIIRDIYENSQNGKIDVEEYINENETE